MLAFNEHHRLLKNSDDDIERIYAPESKGKDVPGFKMYIEPDEMSDASKLKLKYKVKTFGSEIIQIELEFE